MKLKKDVKSTDEQATVEFVCNICGVANACEVSALGRESGQCRNCKSYSRLRSMVHALMQRHFPDCRALWNAPLTKRVKGVGCSDSQVYAKPLAQVFDYVNSHYDRAPQLDLTDIDWSRWEPGSMDFITASDVLEHVEPPVGQALRGALKLLKPGGVFVLTVPTTPWDETIEHFSELEDWEVVREKGKKPVLVNRKANGEVERHTDLTFHGGEGMTLEFRRFSRKSLIAELENAGYDEIEVLEEDVSKHGILLSKHNCVVVAKKGAEVAKVTTGDPASVAVEDSPIKGATPLFVLGAPRSGTTLTADLLNSHPEVLITNEVRVFSFFSHALTHIPDGDSGGVQYARSHPDALVASLREAVPGVVYRTFERISRKDGRKKLKYWGDKNPHHSDCLELIVGAFPNARFVRVKRDPRDVACSIMEMNKWDVQQAGRAVRTNIQRARVFLESLPDDAWCDLKYEALVADPDTEIRTLFGDFLRLEDAAPALTWMKENAAYDRHLRFKDKTDFAKRSVARWKRDLSPDQVKQLEEVLGDVVASEGY